MEATTDIAAVLSRSQRKQLAQLIFGLYLVGQGELELVVENGCPKRYVVRHDPLYTNIPIELSDEDFSTHFGEAWPWWCSIAAALSSILARQPAYGSVWLQIAEGHVRAVREANHIPTLPRSDRLKPPGLRAP